MAKDHYQVMGVVLIKSKEKIREVYRSVSKKYRGGVKDEIKSLSEADMRNMIEAYNVLNDEKKREEYDSQAHRQIRKTASKSIAAPKKKQHNRKEPFKWASPLMDIITGKALNERSREEESTHEEKALMHFTEGVLLAEDRNRLEESKKQFLSAMRYIPDFKEALYNSGIVFYRMGQFDEALNCFRKVLELDGGDLQAKKMMELL